MCCLGRWLSLTCMNMLAYDKPLDDMVYVLRRIEDVVDVQPTIPFAL